ncbi:MAG: phosphoglucosamine mutase, partial [Dehalococcoidales bacterium]|nr:phosphoglucosamine mutase [Dehalococcoidales bacterium]
DASMAIDEMGLAVRRTRIGDTWVSEELRHGGDFGGETSGCWIFPEISLCPDGIYAAALITRMAAGRKLSELVDSIQSYPLLRHSINGSIGPLSRVEEEMMRLKPVSVDATDGLKLNFTDGWILVRPSGTEPKVRLTAEGKTEERAQYLMDAALAAVNHSIAAGGASL